MKGKQPRHQNGRQEPPSLEGDESRHPLLGTEAFVPYTEGIHPGAVTSLVQGAGGRVWVDYAREKEMFRVERHLFHASHASALTHWEQQTAAAAAEKAVKAKKKPNPKPDTEPPAEQVRKPAKGDPRHETKQAPQP